MSDIFISYKTNGGDDLARFLYKSLTGDGYDVFADVELLRIQNLRKHISIELLPCQQKADLSTSKTMQILMTAKEKTSF